MGFTGIPTNTIVRSTTKPTDGNDSPTKIPSLPGKRSEKYDDVYVVGVLGAVVLLIVVPKCRPFGRADGKCNLSLFLLLHGFPK